MPASSLSAHMRTALLELPRVVSSGLTGDVVLWRCCRTAMRPSILKLTTKSAADAACLGGTSSG